MRRWGSSLLYSQGCTVLGLSNMLTVMLAAVALLADSTTAAKPPPAPKSQASDIVCHKELQLGSNIPTKVCRSKSEEAADRTESRQTLERIQAMTPPPGGH
jgi:hypothetical protein